MRLKESVGDDGLGAELGVVVGEAGIGVGAVVVPGPAVESVLGDVGGVVRGEVVAEVVAFVDGDPDLAGGSRG